ncbi:PREDICTED: uncharacterized protein LOC109158578 [Ipomoea nil]|uniref:uncharacterized protein LOC109158578 n=1 Tax=Ipomoea nil TaxID=35883 RepID=UPI0009016FF3|nr:PREDICTED: uncharacterized protein LOC109158578 [Ipomoea nil]
MVSERQRSYAAAVTTNTTGNNNPMENVAGSSSQTAMNPNQRSEEFDDPLYLHVTENPNLSLVSPQLTELNYASWSRSMRIALEVKNKFGFVIDAVPVPDRADPRLASWGRCNRIVCSWILKSISPSIAESVMYFDKASDIWKALEKRYSQSDPHRISEIQNEIFKNVQGNMTMNEYFTKSNALWQQMNSLRPLLLCECVPRCSCTLVSRMQKQREEDQIIRFLEGLNEEYEAIKSGVLVMDPIPEMEKVLNMTLKVERKIRGSLSQKSGALAQSNAIQNQVEEEPSVVAASTLNNKKKFTNNMGRSVPKCTFCDKTGHTVEKCYKKHGFPPGWVAGYKSKNRHTQGAQQASNAAMSQVADIGISTDQLQKLLSLLQNQNQTTNTAAVTVTTPRIRSDFGESHDEGKLVYPQINTVLNSQSIWILDSGATDHISCSLDYFEMHHKICGVSVKLPNGETVKVTHVGQIRLDENVLLQNVLFIPSFAFNIVSASKLTKQSDCKLVMEADFCAIQGPHGMVDGFAKQKDGLYLISALPVRKGTQHVDKNVEKLCSNVSVQIWHNRLGHYPVSKLPLLNGIKSAFINKEV